MTFFVLSSIVSSCSGEEPTPLRAAVKAFARESGGFDGALDEDCLTERLARFDDATLESATLTGEANDFENLSPSLAPVFAVAASCTTETPNVLVESVTDAFVEAAVTRHPDRDCVKRAIEGLEADDLQAAADGMLDSDTSERLADRLQECLDPR